MNQSPDYTASALLTISLEKDAIAALEARIDDIFTTACELLFQCSGRVIVMGMGKSGHIANKIAATLASTGTPAHFVHPAEASHGDIGMVTQHDVVLALSNSGATPELVAILPVLKRKGVPLVAITGDKNSILAQAADANINASVAKEACPLGLAPTTSTTAALVMGDALAMALLQARGFTADDFASSHPGGSLGRRLLLKVKDIMHTNADIPRVGQHTTISNCLLEISEKKLGMTTIIDEQDNLVGIFTDGDLRRYLDKGLDIHTTEIKDIMTNTYKSITANVLASAAAKLMQDNEVYNLIVLDQQNALIGIITMHDLLKADVV